MTSPLPSPPTPPLKRIADILGFLARFLSVGVTLAILAPLAVAVSVFAPGPAADTTTVIVPHGANAADIGAQLVQEHAVCLSPAFRIAARLVASGSLKAGEYAIPAHASAFDIATMMNEGRSIVRLFTVPEGLTSHEIAALINQEPVLTGTIDVTPPEGSLLPQTYRYNYGDTRAMLVQRMEKAMQEKIDEVWAKRDGNLPLHAPQEMVALASIVEKETGKPQERPRIAGVFYNRLRLNMRLQSDPTVIYAITQGQAVLERPLTHDDLALPSPYNTYAHDGIPPQAICNPGLAALEAVAHPEHNNYLYFVADGTGGHAFAADLAAHNENINRWHQATQDAAGHRP